MSVTWILILILEIIKYLLLGIVFFEVKIKRIWIAGVTVFIYAGVISTKILLNTNNIAIGTVSFIMVMMLFMLDAGIKVKAVWILKICFLTACMDSITNALLKILVGNKLGTEEIYYILSNVITIFLVNIVYWGKKKYINGSAGRKSGVLKAVVYICTVIMGISLFMTVGSLEYSAEYMDDFKFTRLANILAIISLFSILLLGLFLFYVNDTNRELKKYLETEKLLKETQQNYYEAMLQKEEDTRRFRHDMINHLMCLRELVEQKEDQSAAEYIENLQNGMREIQQKCYSMGNPVIDAILNYYIQLIGEDIAITVTGNCPKEIGINQVDLCTVFSNLVKNAVEELTRQKEGKKYLKVCIQTGEKDLKIEISNSTDRENKNRKEFLPETVKADKENHGIGLRNVKETVEKNHGIFQWKCEGNHFDVMVVLPMKEENR